MFVQHSGPSSSSPSPSSPLRCSLQASYPPTLRSRQIWCCVQGSVSCLMLSSTMPSAEQMSRAFKNRARLGHSWAHASIHEPTCAHPRARFQARLGHLWAQASIHEPTCAHPRARFLGRSGREGSARSESPVLSPSTATRCSSTRGRPWSRTHTAPAETCQIACGLIKAE